MVFYILLESKKKQQNNVIETYDVNKFTVLDKTNIHLNLYKQNRTPYMYFSHVNLLSSSTRNTLSNGIFTTNSLEIIEIKHIRELELWNDDKFCEYVVQTYLGGLRYVKAKPNKILNLALRKDGNNLKYIEDQTLELIIEGVSQNGMALQYARYKSPEIYFKALEGTIYAYNFIENPSFEMKIYVVKKSKYGLQLIKDQTPEICNAAVESWPESAMYINEPSEELLKKKLEVDGICIYYIHNPTKEMILISLKNCPFILNQKTFLKTFGQALFLSCQSKDFLRETVRTNGKCLKYIDDQTFEICEEAIKNTCFAYQFIKSLEYKQRLRQLAYDTCRNKYMKYNNYIEIFKPYLKDNKESSSVECVKYLFSYFSVEDLRLILSQNNEIYRTIQDKFLDYQYEEIKDFLEKFGVCYRDQLSYSSCATYELKPEHQKLLEKISFNDTDVIMNILDGNLEICYDFDMDIKNILDKLDINENGDIEFIKRDSKRSECTETHIINGAEIEINKHIHILTYEEAENWDSFWENEDN